MLISSDAHAGEIVSSREDTRFYDDIGCLAADWAAHRAGPDGFVAFVRVARGGWTEVHSASYARPDGVATPMGSGIAAFASIAEARAAARDGQVLTFDAVVGAAGAR